MRKLGKVFFLVGLSVLVFLPPGVTGQTQRSPKIHPVLEDPEFAMIPPGRSPFMLEEQDGRLVARVRTLDADELLRNAPRLGVVVRAIVGEIASVEVPRAALRDLAALPSVVSIRPAPVDELLNDISTVEVGADAAAGTFGATGQGVIVAVIDTGLDFRHPDFRNADGTSRVMAAWDQTDPNGHGKGCGPGITFGRCWSKADLDADLAGGMAAGLSDGCGHGTHVAGTAAGNGRATANGVPSGTYAGVAPEADLIIVKAFNSQCVQVNKDTPAALAWIADQAAAAGKPVSVNMSFGGHSGAHDGTSAEEMAIDAFLAPGVTSRAVAIAAGNSRNDGIHAAGIATVGASTEHAFQIPSYTPAKGSDNDFIIFDLWYEGGDNLTVSVLDPGNLVLATATPGTSTAVCTTSGRVSIDALNTTDPDNLDSEVIIRISDSSLCKGKRPAPPSGQIMTLRVTGVAVPAGGTYHIWARSALGSGSAIRFTQPEESMTMTMPATSLRAMAVGGYFTRLCFPNADPNTGTTCPPCSSVCPPIGGLAEDSGAGPTRDGRLKPEVVAPYTIVSSLSSAAPLPTPQYRSPDGLHTAMGGTSMATPHVAGATALMLQFNPQLDAGQVRQILIDSARADAFTGALPNQLYGHGKLDVFTAVQTVQ